MSANKLPESFVKRSARYAVVGLGATGLSCARFLRDRVDSLVLLDSRQQPPNIEAVLTEFNNVDILLGELSVAALKKADFLVVSPGVALQEKPIAETLSSGVTLLSDLDLFRMAVQCPVVCITGSNGKSTVATLLQQMALKCDRRAILCGNIGLPVLDALTENVDLYVVEVSSFQLERSQALRANAAAVLNVSPDHMDRYDSFEHYASVKKRIYNGALICVANRGDDVTFPSTASAVVSFGVDEAANDDFGILVENGVSYLSRGQNKFLPVSSLRMNGVHNQQNTLAALALADAVQLDLNSCCEAATEFSGLEHRCEYVASVGGVDFVNDSKGTNTGATLAAIEGLAVKDTRNIILLAGGVGKDADFSVLAQGANRAVKQAIVFGSDARAIAAALESVTEIAYADSIDAAVQMAQRKAEAGDTVLLSPACASFDMFNGFEHRGDHYKACVRSLSASEVSQ